MIPAENQNTFRYSGSLYLSKRNMKYIINGMKSIEEIETAVKNLPPEDFERFRTWYEEFEADQWDRQFKEDVHKGRLEKHAKRAIKDFEEGRCTEL